MSKVFLITSVLLLFALGCKTQSGNTRTSSKNELIIDNSQRKLLLDKEIFAATTDAVPLDTAYLSEDILHIVTKKIQGCNAENFKLIWNGMTAKSLPPQVTVKLFQQVDGSCKEGHSFHLTYNIAALKLSKGDSASTILKVGGMVVMYKY